MDRRALLIASGAWLAAAAALTSRAQTGKAPRRIGILAPGTQAAHGPSFDVFQAALKQLGYVEGRDVVIETRWAEGRSERLASLAAEVVALNPAVIVTVGSAAAVALKKATSSIPIVFAAAYNPVEQGLVSGLRRPGGNVTGIMVYSDLAGKMVEVAREAFPLAQRLAILVNDADSAHKVALEAFLSGTRRFKFEPVVVRATRAEDLDGVFRELAARKAELLYMADLVFTYSNQKQLIERSLKARLPLLTGFLDVAANGALLSYGTPREENYRRAAALVDKILRGAKPGELPVEQPERFELVVNLKTAKAIGVTLSPVTMLRATKVIE